MKAFTLLALLLLSLVCPAQDLHLGLGMVIGEKYFNETVVDLDSLVIFEDNKYSSHQLIPSFRYEIQTGKHFSLNLGLQYYKTALGLSTYKKTTHPLGPVLKVTSVSLPTFEIPISALYRFPYLKKINLRAESGIVGAFNIIKAKSDYRGDPTSEDFPPSIADVLNSAGSIPRKTYMNYYYGFSLTYKKLGFSLSRYHTLSKSLSDGLLLWDKHFDFKRKAQSIRSTFTYLIFEKNKE